MTALTRGDRVIIDPDAKLATDSLAEDWRGRKCVVLVQVHGSIFKYVKCEDIENGQRGTFREKDVRRITA